jgi:hypothetical protein
VQRTGDSQELVGYSMVGRSRCQVMLCVVCTVHKDMRSVSFLFGLKTKGDGFSRFGLKTSGFEFLNLGLKTSNYDLVIWPTKSPR